MLEKKVHELIDGLNLELRSVENYNGKERKREFYAMSKEQAYGILKSISIINNLARNLVIVDPTSKEIKNEEYIDGVLGILKDVYEQIK